MATPLVTGPAVAHHARRSLGWAIVAAVVVVGADAATYGKTRPGPNPFASLPVYRVGRGTLSDAVAVTGTV